MYNYLVCIDISVDGEREHDTIILSFPRACGETELQDVFDDVCNEITVETLDEMFPCTYEQLAAEIARVAVDRLGGSVSVYAFPLTLNGIISIESQIYL